MLIQKLGLTLSPTTGVPYITYIDAMQKGVADECARLAQKGMLVEVPFSGRRDPTGSPSSIFAWAMLSRK